MVARGIAGLDGTKRYREKARRAGLPVRADFAEFWRDVKWMGLQRHLEVAGIFERLRHRDGKQGYVEQLAVLDQRLSQ